uniref:Uncharacterized protein LOC100176248 n=1 Tax=Phallusia mammillata TaxID=59560 RepID=A0A6F9DFW0_9ASCI|nr:uncharacterized protein LOC100176248 [Phallusia mammillata]
MAEKEASLIFSCSIDKLMRSIKGLECPLCYDRTFPRRIHLQNHMTNVHFKYRFKIQVKKQTAYVLPCRKDCFQRKSSFEATRSHFHCPNCEKTFGRSQSFKGHLEGKCHRQRRKGMSAWQRRKAQIKSNAEKELNETNNNSETSNTSATNVKSDKPEKQNQNNEDLNESCNVQMKILQVLEDLLQVEKQRLDIEKQKLHLSKLQASYQFFQS